MMSKLYLNMRFIFCKNERSIPGNALINIQIFLINVKMSMKRIFKRSCLVRDIIIIILNYLG